MYLENLIIKARERYDSKFNPSFQLKEYFFICHAKRSFKSLFPIIYRAYSPQKNVFAQLLGFTNFFMYDLIISYRWVYQVWMHGVAREIRKVLKMSNGEMFDIVKQTAMAEAYSWMNRSLT